MALEDFRLSRRETFRVESGKLLFADPFNLGYADAELQQRILSLKKEHKEVTPHAIMMPYGFLLDDFTDAGWNLYRLGGRIESVDDNMDGVKERIFRRFYNNLCKDAKEERERAYERLREKGFRFSIPIDQATMFVGDAGKFCVDPSKREIRDYNDYALPEFLQKISPDYNMAESLRRSDIETAERVNNQVVRVKNGMYEVRVDRDKRLFVVKRVRG